jgi:hypothetical protein
VSRTQVHGLAHERRTGLALEPVEVAREGRAPRDQLFEQLVEVVVRAGRDLRRRERAEVHARLLLAVRGLDAREAQVAAREDVERDGVFQVRARSAEVLLEPEERRRRAVERAGSRRPSSGE